ncbi:MAG TPA: malto-oligosyltrehalose synthase [Micropepsaceae bacterium]|nr:malto-oligosyltrehalose synthase [Micropepsaceae bacterium]
MRARATYRLQFHKDFSFAEAAKLAPYLATLGISHLYASPILAARAGSTHGYDVVDHARVNPELGGENGFRMLANAFHAEGLGIVLDIVPNHMAVGGADNPYWLDLLEKGRDSVFANLFDIDWEPAQPHLRDKVLVPYLAKRLADAVEAGDISLIWDENLGKFAFVYGEHRFPLRREDYPAVLGGAELPAQADLRPFNEPAVLGALLAEQNFRLAYWRNAGDRINWRRFFDITGLAALRVEDDGVFELTHAAIFRLYSDGLIDGVRVDHVDGLADPRAYCRRLRARLEALSPQRERKEPAYIVVEKILAPGECLPGDWNVDGTTGYDFMNQVSALQHDGSNADRFGKLWADISGRPADFETEERMARHETVAEAFANALRAAAAAFRALVPDTELDQIAFEQGLSLLLEYLRAYRTYATGDSPDPPPGKFFEAAYDAACHDADTDLRATLDSIAAIMRGEQAAQGTAACDAVRRFNQLAAPVAAKAVEDTAFYRYGRLLSRNDVGFAPACFAQSSDAFFAKVEMRRDTFPQSLLATATHDHKRGEDVRARLAALSEIPDQWESEVRVWFALNTPLRGEAVAPGDEYHLYQTLVGCWPLDLRPDSADAMENFVQRIVTWREKSLREAKLQTSWETPNRAFEKANSNFVRAILDPSRSRAFLDRLADFVERLAPAGILNSLVQCILRCSCPGIPDLYQGTELWDFSLVDPDNRRPVDFTTRQAYLNRRVGPSALLAQWRDGHVKLALIDRLLALRGSAPECFHGGDFRPLDVRGTRADHVVAFSYGANGKFILVGVPRLCAKACMERRTPLPSPAFWGECAITLPAELRECMWRNALDEPGARAPILLPRVAAFDCALLFADFPAAVLVSES